MISRYNWENFYIKTIADWNFCEIPYRKPDYISYSGSSYWDFKFKVIRWSDHWGERIASCCWYLDYKTFSKKGSICGECYYEDFRSIYERNRVI